MNIFRFGRNARRKDLDEELNAHVAMAAQDRVERGETQSSAEQSARRELGNVGLVKEVTEDVWGGRWWRNFLEDVRYGLRVLAKNPGFATIAVFTLALGIGANTALFSIVNGVLLNPLPYPHPEQLTILRESKPNFAQGSVSYPNFLDWRKDNTTFSSMAAVRFNSFILTGLGDAEQIDALFVTSDFFSTLGVNPVLGRSFAPGEDRIGAAPTVMISAGFWKRKFASDPAVLGKTLTLDGRDFTVIGVVPASFNLVSTISPREIYAPLGQWTNTLLMNRGAGLGIFGVGRLKPGVTLEQARADMQRVAENLSAAYPDADKGIGAVVLPMRERLVGSVQPLLLVLLGAVGFVLLIACVNVANLLLARSTSRSQEFAVRAALGAGRWRIIRQLLTESLLLATIGGTLGVFLASIGTQGALRVLPETLPRAPEVQVDGRVLGFAVAVSLFAGLCFGLIPAFKISKLARVSEALKEGGRGKTAARHRLQHSLVAVEMALAVVLLIGAGLMVRTLSALWHVNPGFDPDNVLSVGLSLPPAMSKATPDAIRAALRQVHEKFETAPGVQSVSFTWGATPLGYDDEWLFWIDGRPKPSSESDLNWALNYVVEPDYLRVMRIPLKAGRFFTDQDDEHALHVAVVDDVFAEKYFPGENPIGKRLHIMNNGNNAGQTTEIVGLVGHVKQWGLDNDEKQSLRAELYTPFLQLPDAAMSQSASGLGVLLRSQGSVPVFESIRRASREMSSDQVVFGAQTMNDMIASSLSSRRFSMILLAVFAGLALLLASVGIYGVVSYLVGQRTREIGVRIAMGAQRGEVLRMVLRQGGKMAAIGAAVGAAAALLLTRVMGSMLYGTSPADPVTYLVVLALLVLVALAACWVPASRAARLNPVDALRYE